MKMTDQPRILVIDDDEAVLFAFSRIFRTSGVGIDTATTVADAKGLIDSTKYALVLTDLRLEAGSPIGGIDIIRHTREHSPGTATVLWTAYDSEAGARDFAEADFVLTKPAPSEKIMEILNRVCSTGSNQEERKRQQ